MVKKGPFVMIGGTTAVQPDGTVYGETPYEQAKYIFAKFVKLLAKAGAAPEDVVKVEAFITDMKYGKEVGEGYGSTFQSSKATKPVYTKVENQRDFGSAGGALSYQVGDRVRHIKFGDGEVMAIVSGGRDYEVTVDFENVGTKKMFASFAKLQKI